MTLLKSATIGLAAVAIAIWAVGATAQDDHAGHDHSGHDHAAHAHSDKSPSTQPAASATQPAKDEVAVVVDGHKIMESDFDELFRERMGNRMDLQSAPPQRVAQIRQRVRKPLMDELIMAYLLEQAFEEESITITDEELEEYLEAKLTELIEKQGMTREQYAELFKQRTGMTLEEGKARTLKQSGFRNLAAVTKLMKREHGDELEVTDEEIKKYYEENLEKEFTQPKQVQASHILVGTRELKTDEEKKEAEEKAEMILEKVEKEDSDFGALAEEYSDCPSGKRSEGDLGYFSEQGPIDPTFTQAAFDLKVGETSDVVKTPFGYHIIKVTDRKEAKVVSLEEAKEQIRNKLREQKAQKWTREYQAKIKDEAEIVYPEGKEPQAPQQMRPQIRMQRPSTQPAESQ